jgi:3-hydroxyisobutyrate dehydrogenase-like beta-hydroxyacid dehydrogenase
MSKTIGLMSPGDMGGGVAKALVDAGIPVVTCVAGRSEETVRRARDGGLQTAPDLAGVIAACDLFLSIMPPERAEPLAAEVAAAMRATGKTPAYADCNAISPATVNKVGATVSAAGARFIDAGIIGRHPGHGVPTRFFCSGPYAGLLDAIAVPDKIIVKKLGDGIGQASGLKMCYAALTKGTNTLRVSVLMTAKSLGLYDDLIDEFAFSQQGPLKQMKAQLPTLACDSGRWIREMEEIAATFADAGVTPGFHEGAAFVHKVLAASPLGEETRLSADKDRSLDESLDIWMQYLPKNRG